LKGRIDVCFCSTIIPTVGRTTLSRAVESVLDQSFIADDFEIIVVNDSGKPLRESHWQKSESVQIINTGGRERSIARNTGATLAKGCYLHFLDDDDWIVPDAFNHLWALAQASDAAWLYGGTQLVDRQGKKIIELHHRLHGNCFVQVMAGEWIPLQASLIEASAFFAVGGFNPLISGPEDIELLRRIALHSDIAGTHEIIACVAVGQDGSTTDYQHHPELSRWAREKTLNSPGFFPRIRSSADSSYWYGRVVRIFLTSLVWNVQHRHICTAASRALFGLASIALASLSVFSSNFWRAIMKPYSSETFARGFQDASANQ
jgi:glycosyltransferase involved in cell wall biosynthesis